MINAIVLYYSLEGNTEYIAKIISQEIECKLIKIKPLVELNYKKFSKYFWGGKQVLMNEKPTIEKIDIDFEDYDLIIIGTPVWAWNYSPPIKTFVFENKITDKYLAFFSTHEGGKGKTLENLEKEFTKTKNHCIGKIDFKDVLKNKEKSKIIAQAWAEEIFNKLKLDKEIKTKIN